MLHGQKNIKLFFLFIDIHLEKRQNIFKYSQLKNKLLGRKYFNAV